MKRNRLLLGAIIGIIAVIINNRAPSINFVLVVIIIGAFIGFIAGAFASAFKNAFLIMLIWAVAGAFISVSTGFGAWFVPSIIGGIMGAIGGVWVEEADIDDAIIALPLLVLTGVIGYVSIFGCVFIREITTQVKKQQNLSQAATATSQIEIRKTATAKTRLSTTEARRVGRIVPIQEDLENISFSPDGHKFITTGQNVTVWNTVTLQEIIVLNNHSGLVTGVSYSPDGLKLATADENGLVKIWDTQTWREISRLNCRKGYTTVTFSPDGQKIVAKSGSQFIAWNTNTNEQLYLVRRNSGTIIRVTFSPDGNHIAGVIKDGVQVWDANNGQEAIYFGSDDSASKIVGISYHPDGHNILVARTNGTAEIWDTNNWKKISTLNLHRARYATYSPDGHHILTAGIDRTARIWDVTTGREIATLGQGASVDIAIYSPDGRTILTKSHESVTVWETQALRDGGIFLYNTR